MAPAPTAALAYVWTQGDVELDEFVSRVDGDLTVGQKIPLYRSIDEQTANAAGEAAEPYFSNNYIDLAPEEVREASLTVKTSIDAPGLIEFRFVVDGSGPGGRFTVRDDNYFELANLDVEDADHHYVDGYVDYMKGTGVPTATGFDYDACADVAERKWFAGPTDGRRCP